MAVLGGSNHHKFAIVDGQVVLDGSYNYSMRAATKNNEHIVGFRNSPLAAVLTGMLDEHFRQSPVALVATNAQAAQGVK